MAISRSFDQNLGEPSDPRPIVNDIAALINQVNSNTNAITSLQNDLIEIEVRQTNSEIVTDDVIGNRTINDTVAPTSNTGQISVLLNGLANRITNITGESGWKNDCDINLSSVKLKFNKLIIDVTDSIYGAVGDGVTDDTDAIQAALDVANTAGGGIVFFPVGTYLYTSLTLYSNTTLKGVNWRATILQRSANAAGIVVEGTSVLEGTSHIRRNIYFEDIRFHGGDFTENMIELTCIDFFMANRCHFFRAGGRGILATELFDSRFNNCYFTWLGNEDGTLPGIDLTSGGDYDCTNQIVFSGCDFESNRGTVLELSGSNTNEIFFSDTKFENLESNQINLKIGYGASVYFNSGCTFCTRGTNGETIPSVIDVQHSQNIRIYAHFEHISSTPATLTNFINCISSNHVDMFCTFKSTNWTLAATDKYCVKTDGINTYNYRILGTIVGDTGGTKVITNNSNQETRTGRIMFRRAGEPSISFCNTTANDDDVWQLGRIIADGTSTKWRIYRYRNSVESVPFEIQDNSSVKLIAGGTWQSCLQLGSYYLWVDSTGDLRIKSSSPTSDTDGTIVGTQS